MQPLAMTVLTSDIVEKKEKAINHFLGSVYTYLNYCLTFKMLLSFQHRSIQSAITAYTSNRRYVIDTLINFETYFNFFFMRN